jgi:hypothetical protein
MIKPTQLDKKFTYLFLMLCLASVTAYSQDPTLQNIGGKLKQLGGSFGQRSMMGGETDSLRHRNKLEDSITITYRYLDSTVNYVLDSSIIDFTNRFPAPATNIYLGNIGNASRSLLFSPLLNSGFDPGFHAFDVYRCNLDQVRFFNTTRPYSELTYQLGSRVEQMIEVLHTQNRTPNWNFLFQYRMINSPGFFKNQKTSHNNYLFTSRYQSNKKRYGAYLVLLGNKLQSGENGGIIDTVDYLNDPIYKDRFIIPTKIGGTDFFSGNFFSNKIYTGNKYSEFTFLLRQQYDFGKKDSLVTDSTVIPLFFPRLRLEHSFTFSTLKYQFLDQAHNTSGGFGYMPDSAWYQDNYQYTLLQDTFAVQDKWRSISNDFSIYQFPDAKNQHQFFKVGLLIQNLHGEFTSGSKNFFNTAGHAEYRNKTKNQQWDIEAFGNFISPDLILGILKHISACRNYWGKKWDP